MYQYGNNGQVLLNQSQPYNNIADSLVNMGTPKTVQTGMPIINKLIPQTNQQSNQQIQNITKLSQQGADYIRSIPGVGASMDMAALLQNAGQNQFNQSKVGQGMSKLGFAPQGNMYITPQEASNPLNEGLKDVANVGSLMIPMGQEGWLARLGTGALAGGLASYGQPNSSAGGDIASAGIGGLLNAVLPGVGNLASKATSAVLDNSVNKLTPYLGEGVNRVADEYPDVVTNLASKLTGNTKTDAEMLYNELKGNGSIGQNLTDQRSNTFLTGPQLDNFYNKVTQRINMQNMADPVSKAFNDTKSNLVRSIQESPIFTGEKSTATLSQEPVALEKLLNTVKYMQGVSPQDQQKVESMVRDEIADKINNPTYVKNSTIYRYLQKGIRKLDSAHINSDYSAFKQATKKIPTKGLGQDLAGTMVEGGLSKIAGINPMLAVLINGGKFLNDNKEQIGRMGTAIMASDQIQKALPLMQGLSKITGPAFGNNLIRQLGIVGLGKTIGAKSSQ